MELEEIVMNLLSYYKEAGSSGEKSRILVVYALLGTAFFMPLNLIAMEVCFIVALLLGVRCLLTENLGLWQSSPFCKPVVAFAFIALFIAGRFAKASFWNCLLWIYDIAVCFAILYDSSLYPP